MSDSANTVLRWDCPREFKSVEMSYGDTVLNLVVATGYVSRVIGNPRTCRYLERHHPEILDEFKAIVAAASLEEASRVVGSKPHTLLADGGD